MSSSSANTGESSAGLYRTLDRKRNEIRLLTVKASQHDDPIVGSLHHVSLSAWRKPKYETVSYRWGDTSVKFSINVDGVDVAVPKGAIEALRRLRLPDQDRVLWMDSVCINQDDVDERSQQVSIMDDIYRSTWRNLVHLGEDDEGQDSAQAVASISLIRAQMSREAKDYTTLYNMVTDEMSVLRDSQTPIGVQFDPKPLLDFYSRPWWRRVWIMQEVALPPKSVCYCGEYQIPLSDVLNVAMWLMHKRFSIPAAREFDNIMDPPVHLWFKADHDVAGSSRSDEISVMNTFGEQFLGLFDFEATDARDRVFGVLGMYRGKAQLMAWTTKKLFGNIPPLLAPDYKKSLMEVYRDATRYMVEESDALDVLQFLYHSADNALGDGDWPTWVPKWHMMQNTGTEEENSPTPLASFFRASNQNLDSMWRGSFHRLSALTQSMISTSKRTTASVHFSEDSNILLVQGTVVDTVVRTTSIMTKDFLESETRKWWQEVLDSIYGRKDARPQDGDQEKMKTMGYTLMAGSTFDGQPAVEDDLLQFAAWVQYIDQNESIPPPLQDIASGKVRVDEETRQAARYRFSSYHGCHRRRFFATQAGLLGVGPQTMQMGDIVTVLRGCRWPCVLRQNGDYYAMIGCCYTHNIMFGETVKKGKKIETFRIR